MIDESYDEEPGERGSWQAHFITRKVAREAWTAVGAALTTLIAVARESPDPATRAAVAVFDERTRAALVLGKKPKERAP